MQINSINNSPKFEARIKIQKQGFQNIAKDFGDSSSVSGNSGAMTSSCVGETTIFPFELFGGNGFAEKIKTNYNKIMEHFTKIFQRNVQTTIVENPENLKAFSKQSASATSGSSLISSGIESYAGSLGSALDQSVHYPMGSVYDRSVPVFLDKNAPEEAVKVLKMLTDSAYDLLYNERGLGNECASSASSVFSGIGVGSQGIGSTLISESSKKMSEIVSKKIPS